MSINYTTVVGSGQVPFLQNYPTHQFVDGIFPIPCKSYQHRIRTGDGVVILNPEDFSINVGTRTQAIDVQARTALPESPLEYRRALVVHNNSDDTIYIGDENVTVNTGMPLCAGEKIAFDIQGNPNVTIYAVAAVSSDIRIMELA